MPSPSKSEIAIASAEVIEEATVIAGLNEIVPEDELFIYSLTLLASVIKTSGFPSPLISLETNPLTFRLEPTLITE